MELLKLTNENIDRLSDEIEAVYSRSGCSLREQLRVKLLLEEALLRYQSSFGVEAEVQFRTYTIFNTIRFCVYLHTPSFDPFEGDEGPMAAMVSAVMNGLEGSSPTWRYHNRCNELVFSIHRKAIISDISKIAIAVGLSVLLGILCRFTVNHDALLALVTDYLTPFADTYAGLFCVMAAPFMLFSITLAIVSTGDFTSLGALSQSIIKRFYRMLLGAVVVLTLPLLPFFDFTGHGDFQVAAKSIYDILISFIPNNFVSPFLDFNSTHIMIVAVMFGLSLLSMGQKGENTVTLFGELNALTMYTNNFLNRFAFLYVGIELFTLIATGEFSVLTIAGKMVAAILLAEALLFVFYALYGAHLTQKPLIEFCKIMMPAFIIALSSANLGACSSSMDIALDSFDVDCSLSDLANNIGSILFQPACTTVLVFSSLFMAYYHHMAISPVWLLTTVLLSVVLVAAVPDIPGAAVAVFTLLYSQLGLPDAALGLMIAVYAVLQFPTVAVDAWCLECEIVCQSCTIHRTTTNTSS